MPYAPARYCQAPACPHKAEYKGRCQVHARAQEQQRYNASTRKWYSTEDWRLLRLAVLSEQPICVECRTAASTEVDHKVPHRGDYVRFWDRGNLQGMCKACHGRKTQRGE